MSQLLIGDVNIQWESQGTSWKADQFTDLFKTESDLYTNGSIILREMKMKPEVFEKARILQKTGGYELLQTDYGVFVMNHWAQCRFGYGFWAKDLESETVLPIYVNPKMKNQIPLSMDRFLSTIGLHGRFLRKDGLVLHGSYIEYCGKAIIFTAPSQTGKSTQAELWKLHKNAKIINGDRVLLRKRENKWQAFGYPCCGSSLVCENVTLPLAAIVILEQNKENKLEEMVLGQIIRSLVGATELYPWMEKEIGLAFSLAMEVVKEIPVVKLKCRPDKEAVEVLQIYLEEKGIW